jgi:UDP-N-acetyl-D-mannosaminuronate dehydrogenase
MQLKSQFVAVVQNKRPGGHLVSVHCWYACVMVTQVRNKRLFRLCCAICERYKARWCSFICWRANIKKTRDDRSLRNNISVIKSKGMIIGLNYRADVGDWTRTQNFNGKI